MKEQRIVPLHAADAPEFEGLPDGVKVIDARGNVFARNSNWGSGDEGKNTDGSTSGIVASDELGSGAWHDDITYPVRVIWVPEEHNFPVTLEDRVEASHAASFGIKVLSQMSHPRVVGEVRKERFNPYEYSLLREHSHDSVGWNDKARRFYPSVQPTEVSTVHRCGKFSVLFNGTTYFGVYDGRVVQGTWKSLAEAVTEHEKTHKVSYHQGFRAPTAVHEEPSAPHCVVTRYELMYERNGVTVPVNILESLVEAEAEIQKIAEVSDASPYYVVKATRQRLDQGGGES